MKNVPAAPSLPRGRIAQWSREQLERLSTDELRALVENARALKETEVAVLCEEILRTRRRGKKALARGGAPS
jgi:hypothetical protein